MNTKCQLDEKKKWAMQYLYKSKTYICLKKMASLSENLQIILYFSFQNETQK